VPSVATRRATSEPPAIVGLLAHPLRWRLLQALGESDRPVRELTELIGEPQNLVSYHLRQLRQAGLVVARRSDADGRDSYYAVDLAQCGAQLRDAGGSLHPGLWIVPSAGPRSRRSTRTCRVLFLCTGNSARSQIAEALIEQLSDGAVQARSAGSHPKPLHPNAVRVMRTRGIDISRNRTKHLDEVVAKRFDLVVTLCDRVREVCPELPSHPRNVHWSIPDPAREGASPQASYPAFEGIAEDLETRIRFLLAQIGIEPKGRSRHGER
jgi:ArsR family transcriptional regulator, arsenate/arsenite/antimonite-responsive transcriptional repressor / arsenate reductase (thioredoxin)